MANIAPVFRVTSVALEETPVKLRLPFRFGLITLTEAPQVFVSVTIGASNGQTSRGLSASLLVPKWFDKRPTFNNEDNIEHLRRSLALATDAYTSERSGLSAYGHHVAHGDGLVTAGLSEGLNRLSSNFGAAMLDAAIADALGQLYGQSFVQMTRGNLLGLDPAKTLSEFAGFDTQAWLGSLKPASVLAARHTIGLLDPLRASAPRQTNDGLPETLVEIIARYGHRFFKIKVSGDLSADLSRLEEIAAILDQSDQPYVATLDGNEQFDDADAVQALWSRMKETAGLSRLLESIAFIEQPIRRDQAMSCAVHAVAAERPLIIDESDDSLDAFTAAQALGYSGVSSKLCKGLYKSLINAARCAQAATRGERLFMSAEDLTNQAGVAVQQDLALVSILGVQHVERNGHHYVDGFGGAPLERKKAYLSDHPDLYSGADQNVRLQISNGQLAIESLQCKGFALGVHARQSHFTEQE